MSLKVRLSLTPEKSVLRNLLAAYLSELSEYGDVEIAYPYFDAYWNEGECRWPYVIYDSDQLVGFAFVNTFSPSGRGTDFSFAEFYIVPDARRHGIGRDAAKAILTAHSGVWELSVMSPNAPAQRFWPNAIGAAQVRQYERIEHEQETIYRFRIEDQS